MNKQRGFTLIELLIVLAILAILIGIVAMSIGNIRQTAQQRGLQSERQVVETAIDSYVTLQENLPTVPDVTVGVVITATEDTGFGQYLRRDTKYYYMWSGVGTINQTITATVAEPITGTMCCVADGCGTLAGNLTTCTLP